MSSTEGEVRRGSEELGSGEWGKWKSEPFIGRDGTSPRPVRFARILQRTKRFLLLGIDRDRRFAASLTGLHATSNVFKLGVAIGMRFSLNRLAVRLQRIALRPLRWTPITGPLVKVESFGSAVVQKGEFDGEETEAAFGCV